MRRHWPNTGMTTREKLVYLLELEGFYVDFDDVWEQKGDYRTNRWDLAYWGAYNVHTEQYIGKASLFSWDTMTNCVRYGIKVKKEIKNPSLWEWEVFANK